MNFARSRLSSPLPSRERKKNHWVSGAVATLNPLIFQVRGEWGEDRTPHQQNLSTWLPLTLRQVQDFASSPSRGEGNKDYRGAASSGARLLKRVKLPSNTR